MKINRIKKCRACHSKNFVPLFSLGEQYLTGVFPAKGQPSPPKAPLELLLCDNCGLVQLAHSCDPSFLYGPSYGYRSGLNKSMRQHLRHTAHYLDGFLGLENKDIICDIGCNDGTLLSYFNINELVKIGIDPLADKFRHYHPEGLKICSNFFSKSAFQLMSEKPAKLITSLSMFYDLEDPVGFVTDIRDCLEDEGVWYFEQSYLKLMLDNNSYDTICHEHLEYYSFKAISSILAKAEMKIVDATLNNINGGSMAITAAKEQSRYSQTKRAESLIKAESDAKLTDPDTYKAFIDRCNIHGENLRNKLANLKAAGKKVAGYGASTKGNVLLQYLNLGASALPFILEINEEKRSHVTPGTNISIKLEDEVDLSEVDYFVVLPWHFRDGIIEKEKDFLESGGRFIFPLPEFEIYPAES